MNSLTAKDKIPALLISFIIILLMVAVWAIDKFYFSPKGAVVPPASLMVSEAVKTQNEYKYVEDKLLKNEAFGQLKKHGDWPMSLEEIKRGKEKPFVEVVKLSE